VVTEEALLAKIDVAARSCKTVEDLAKVEGYRHSVTSFSNSGLRHEVKTMKSMFANLEQRLKVFEDKAALKAERIAREE